MLKQLLPSDYCLRCDVCCRFPEATSWEAPFFSEEEIEASVGAGLPAGSFAGVRYGSGESIIPLEGKSGYRCPAFDELTNACCIYLRRPMDCQLYPFMIMYDELGSRVFLAADMLCPFLRENLDTAHVQNYIRDLAESLEGDMGRLLIPGMLAQYSSQGREVAPLPQLSRRFCRADLGLSKLVLTAREAVAPYYALRPAILAAHAFPGCYVWRDLFDLYWCRLHERLLIFAERAGAAFLLVPPLGPGDLRKALREGLEILRALGPVPRAIRVENVDERDMGLLDAEDWVLREEPPESVCDRERMASLAGNKLKGKRSACNYFEKHNSYIQRPYRDADFLAAAGLHRRWASMRKERFQDEVYRSQLDTSFLVHHRAMKDADAMGLTGRVLEADGRLVAYTFGYPLSGSGTFVVMLEVADLQVKGAAQVVFRELCREMSAYRHINVLDDSGLPNLARVKRSYHPVSEVRRFVAVPRKQ